MSEYAKEISRSVKRQRKALYEARAALVRLCESGSYGDTHPEDIADLWAEITDLEAVYNNSIALIYLSFNTEQAAAIISRSWEIM